ncbi:MAG: ABC transporter permease subunit [Chloroflexi bacterium]|nr:ABC transporter permease subunit [Chloroflexota bacterium]
MRQIERNTLDAGGSGDGRPATKARRSRSGRCIPALRSIFDAIWPVLVVAGAWEIFARSGRVPSVLTPTIPDIVGAMLRLHERGLLFIHVGSTLARMLVGFFIAAIIGCVIGMTMAYWRLSERFWRPIISMLMPIPGLAWVPIFILWFGLGEIPTILLVAFVSFLPITVSVWTGVKSANPVWLRAAASMNTGGLSLFRKVIFPAGLPFLFTGLRIGLARSWRAVVAGEFIANTQAGLGWLIFNSIAFLQSDMMFASIVLIALSGYLLERVLVQVVEDRTVVRWGMVQEAGAR